MRNVSLIVNFNRVEYTRACLCGYFNNVKTNHLCVVMDNGSIDGTEEYLKQLEQNKEYLHSLPFEVKFQYNGFNKPFGDIMLDFWKEYNYFEFQTFIPCDAYIEKDYICPFQDILDHMPKVGWIMDRCLREEPFEYLRENDRIVIVKDKYGVVPLGFINMIRSTVTKIPPNLSYDKNGAGWLDFYRIPVTDAGWIQAWHQDWFSHSLMEDPILGMENTQKYKIYREWLHKQKRGEIKDMPPADMYGEIK